MAPADSASEGPKLEDPPAPHLFGKVRSEVSPVVSFHLVYHLRPGGFFCVGLLCLSFNLRGPLLDSSTLSSTNPIFPAQEAGI